MISLYSGIETPAIVNEFNGKRLRNLYCSRNCFPTETIDCTRRISSTICLSKLVAVGNSVKCTDSAPVKLRYTYSETNGANGANRRHSTVSTVYKVSNAACSSSQKRVRPRRMYQLFNTSKNRTKSLIAQSGLYSRSAPLTADVNSDNSANMYLSSGFSGFCISCAVTLPAFAYSVKK